MPSQSATASDTCRFYMFHGKPGWLQPLVDSTVRPGGLLLLLLLSPALFITIFHCASLEEHGTLRDQRCTSGAPLPLRRANLLGSGLLSQKRSDAEYTAPNVTLFIAFPSFLLLVQENMVATNDCRNILGERTQFWSLLLPVPRREAKHAHVIQTVSI